ncbi:universal stress protein [Anaerotalea alkaliphila]|uniref:Universal stress protein n=1 Tax=Anaerotalea alkaliphila TaxID=2662126 RepID=A0A7X5HT90_9FIRM|nr:universal stress protein [Anaerotalea alkaliphila]NDL66223.1 universal stress protein [Anaerotalea alkaliphila]
MMFKRMLVATDTSTASDALVESLEGLRAYGAEQCLLLQCTGIQAPAARAYLETEESTDEALQAQKRVLERQGYTVETRVVSGIAKNEINRVAETEGYSIIVVGAEAHSLTSEVLFSGLAYDVIHHSRLPVLLVRLVRDPDGSEVRASGMKPEGPVLFNTDFSETAANAFRYLESLVEGGTRQVVLFHVQDQSRIYPYLIDQLDEFNRIDTERLENMRQELARKGKAEVECMIRYGYPQKEILQLAREKGAQLIVMGSQGRGFLKEMFLGSVSNSIARQAACSVLLVPARRD